MSLSDRLVKEANQTKQVLCILGELLISEAIPEKDRAVLANAINTPATAPSGLTNSAIARVLREEGYSISNSSVDRHRRGDCGCTNKGN